MLACGAACSRSTNPQAAFERAQSTFRRGDLAECQQEARELHNEFVRSDLQWARKFKILEAKAALWRGLYDEVKKLLGHEPISSDQPDLAIPTLTILGVANVRTRDFAKAEHTLNQAADLCRQYIDPSCGELFQAQGLLASERSDSALAEKHYQLSLAFARSHGDSFLESTSLLNLGAESLALAHYDEALDRSEAGYKAAQRIDARTVKLTTTSNIAWAYYKLGDSERALHLFLDAEKAARQLQFVYDQENELTNVGYIYMDRRQYDLAAKSFQQALDLAESIKAKLHIYNVLRVLARLSLQTNDLDKATEYADRALQIARESGVHADELYPRLVQGQIAAQRGNAAEAEQTFLEIERDPVCPVFLKWEAEHSLALLYETNVKSHPSFAKNAKQEWGTRMKQGSAYLEKADRYYRIALATFENARGAVRRESSQLSFLANGWRIYDDYVRFLVERGRSDEALRWADHSRARTLAEGLGILPAKSTAQPPSLRPQEIARAVKGTLLFYWLGERQSYLWAISPRRTQLLTLPPGPEIDAVARRYREAMTGPQSLAASTNADGQWLYRTLIAPAEMLLPRNSRVFVIPDGSLNNLNFDTLIAPAPQPRYWIEDVTIANAGSLRMLAASYRGDSKGRKLLLIGNSVPPNEKYPALPRAAAQMDGVASRFPAQQERVIAGGQATPQSYLDANPGEYSHIHFVAHGTASRLSPLDSAIVLSKTGADGESFKLYARDIIQKPLRAEVVTISSCYGAGTRAYSGEGLVGLSWAFLRAGAHNVVAALWEATDTPTELLMTKFYDELNRGAAPDEALRAAKLSLLRGGTFSKPVYWAPFQLYTQGRMGPRSGRVIAGSGHRLIGPSSH